MCRGGWRCAANDQAGQDSTLGSLPFILAPGLMIGVLLVAVGLFRARLVRRWVAVLLGVSAARWALCCTCPSGWPRRPGGGAVALLLP